MLHVRDEGHGPAVLLLHGIPGQSACWDRIVAPLRERGFRVLAPDLLGFGASPDAPDVHLAAQADAVAAALAARNVREAHVVAHDFGVPVALTLVARHPSFRLLSVVAAATNLFPDTPIPPPLRLAKVPALRGALFPMLGTVPGARLAFRLASERGGAGAYPLARGSARSTYRIFVKSLAELASIYAPVERTARTLRVPSVVLWGAKDPFFTVATGRRTAEALGARFVELADVGHFVPEEAPDEVLAAFDAVAPRQAAAAR